MERKGKRHACPLFDSLEKKGKKQELYIKKEKKGIADSASSLPCVPTPKFPFWRPPLRASLGTQIARGLSRAPISVLNALWIAIRQLATDRWAEVLGGGGKGGLHLGPGSLDPPRSSYSYSGRDYNGTFRIKRIFDCLGQGLLPSFVASVCGKASRFVWSRRAELQANVSQ